MAAVLLAVPFAFYGQTDNKTNENAKFNDYVYVSGDLGLGFLKGDNNGLKLGLNGHVGIGYQFDNILGIKVNFGYGGLNGKFSKYTIAESNYFEGNINLTVNLTDIILGYNPDRKFNIVPHIGIGQVRYRIKLNDVNGNRVYQNGYDKKHGRKVAATIPMGIEFDYSINPSWKVFVDLTANYADTDLLDGVASGKHNDWFSTVNIGANYRLGSKANIFRRDDVICNYWFLMTDGGASLLFGDNKFNFGNVRGNMNVGIGYSFNNFYKIYGKVGYGIFNGEYKNVFTLNYADYYEANINIAADLVGFIFGYNEARRFGLYAHVGIGQIQYRARATFANGNKKYVGYDHNTNNVKGRGIQGRKVALTVPMGVEFNYIVNDRFDVYADVTTNPADSDILDAFYSGKHKDWYTTTNIGLRYKFNKSCSNDVEEPECCITPEEIKQIIKEALEEQKPNYVQDTIVKTEVKEIIYHSNHANIVFPVNKSEKIKTQTNIDAINRASDEVQNGFEVEKIIVEGYASPEGTDEINNRLAEERAQAAAELIQNELHTHLDNKQVTIHSNGADWDGLVNAILGSDIDNKEDIANRIKNSTDKNQTLKELMNQYPQIRELLPQLRRANVTIKTVK